MGVFSSQERSLLFLRYFRYLRTFRGPSWLLFFLSLDSCYICYFCDVCHGCFQLAWKILVTFTIFAIFEDISGPFLASSLCKSWFLLDLLFLCDFCDICRGCFQLAWKILVTFAIFAIFADISGSFSASLFCFKSSKTTIRQVLLKSSNFELKHNKSPNCVTPA